MINPFLKLGAQVIRGQLAADVARGSRNLRMGIRRGDPEALLLEGALSIFGELLGEPAAPRTPLPPTQVRGRARAAGKKPKAIRGISRANASNRGTTRAKLSNPETGRVIDIRPTSIETVNR